MEWQLLLLLFFGSLMILMASGLSMAMCFITLDLIFMFWLWGGGLGLEQFVLSMFLSVASFEFLPIPLFIIMGEVIFSAGMAGKIVDTLDKWLGLLPGRLGLLAVAGGTLLATLTGTSLASVAVLGSTLVPEMEKRGYKKPMSLGPIMGSGGLAMMIPPSNMAVLLGAVGQISVGKILIAIIVPGLVMAALMAGYIIIRCRLQPDLAPAYTVPPTPVSEKLAATAKYILPLGLIIFLVIGVVFIGVATPTEAAATGALGCFILAACYRGLNWKSVKKSVNSTLHITGMVFLIIASSVGFGQILSFSGATEGLVAYALKLSVAPIYVPLGALVVVLFLGMFISLTAIVVISVPLFVPVITTLGFDPVWFAAAMMVALEVGAISPPFGMSLFVMKGVAPPDTTMGDCYRAALPFCIVDLVALAVIVAFPPLSLWLPGLMRQ